jgi:hypothetical protein
MSEFNKVNSKPAVAAHSKARAVGERWAVWWCTRWAIQVQGVAVEGDNMNDGQYAR